MSENAAATLCMFGLLGGLLGVVAGCSGILTFARPEQCRQLCAPQLVESWSPWTCLCADVEGEVVPVPPPIPAVLLGVSDGG